MAARRVPLAALSLFAVPFAVAACGSNAPAHRNDPQQGVASNAPSPSDPDQGNDPSADNPEQPTPGGDDAGTPIDGGASTDAGGGSIDAGGGSNDAGNPGGSACPAAPSGWRPMALAPHLATFPSFMDAVWTGKEMLVLSQWTDACGASGCTTHDAALAYDPVKDAWRMLATPPFTAGSEPFNAVVWSGAQWILWSDQPPTPTSTATNHGWAFDPATNVWSSLPAAPMTARAGTQGVWSTTTHEMLVFGGSTPSADLGDGVALDPTTMTWRAIPVAPIKGNSAGVVWAGDRMVVAFPSSSLGSDAIIPSSVAASYDPKANAWTSLPTPTGTARIHSIAAAIGPSGHDAAFFSGWPAIEDGDYPNLHDGVYFDGTAWQTIPDPVLATYPFYVRANFASWTANGRLYVWGGSSYQVDVATSTYDQPRQGAFFDPTTGAWTKFDGGPPGREDAVAVWTGCDAIVYGGRSASGDMNDGMLFRP